MNLHIKTGLGIKNDVLDPNSNIEYEIVFDWFFVANLIIKQNQFLTNFEEVIAKNWFSSFSTFWNNCPLDSETRFQDPLGSRWMWAKVILTINDQVLACFFTFIVMMTMVVIMMIMLIMMPMETSNFVILNLKEREGEFFRTIVADQVTMWFTAGGF